MGTAAAHSRARQRLPVGVGPLPGWAAPVALAALLAAVYLVLDPHTVDMAAHVYRSGLFGREGFTIWDGGWYGGHHTPAYSVLFPPLGWLLGPALAGALAAVAASALFVPLSRTRLAALWFAVGAAATLFNGRMPFALGLALGLGALLAFARRRSSVACAVAIVCSLASPVAGAFLALAGVATLSRRGIVLAVAALAPVALLSVAFPEGGYEPFDFSSFVGVPLFCIAALVLLDRSERTLRVGVALYLLAGIAAYAIHTPMGGNVARLGMLFGGPLLAGARLRGPRVVVAAVLVALAYWQLQPAVRDVKKADEDPATQASYYAPLKAELARLPHGPARIEVPFTRAHWEAAEIAPEIPLARGWERQLDIERNSIFYDGGLNASTYRDWLSDNGVSLVALPDARPDYSSYVETALIRRGQPYLRPIWRSRHWRLFEFTAGHGLLLLPPGADARLLSLGNADARIAVRRPASFGVKVAWSQYWRASGACVERDGPWTRVLPHRTGVIRLEMSFSIARVFDHGQRCG